MKLETMLQTWVKVITRPGEDVFWEEKQQEGATFVTALIWMIIAGAIASSLRGIGFWLGFFLFGFAETDTLAQLPSEFAEIYQQQLVLIEEMAPVIFVLMICGGLLLTPITFFVNTVIWYVLAKLFNGTGELEPHTYLFATFTAPTTILSALVGIIPYLSFCLVPLIFLYRMVLTYFAVKTAHGLTSGKALAVVLSWVAFIFFLFCCLGLLLTTLISMALPEIPMSVS